MKDDGKHQGGRLGAQKAIVEYFVEKLKTMSETEIRDKIKKGIENIEIKDTVD